MIRTPVLPNENAGREPEFLDKAPSMMPLQDAVHLCIDMQRIFAKGGVWETPWMERVLPVIADIAARFAERTVFTRFITPENASDRPGQWQTYYRRWQAVTRATLPLNQLELVPELGRFVPPATVIDKPAYSAFFCSKLEGFLQQKSVRTLVVTGAETDICVLSTVLDAGDRGGDTGRERDRACDDQSRADPEAERIILAAKSDAVDGGGRHQQHHGERHRTKSGAVDVFEQSRQFVKGLGQRRNQLEAEQG